MTNDEHDTNGVPNHDSYSAQYASHVDSPTRQRIRREVYGDEYPEDVDPRSFITRTELRSLADALRVGPGKHSLIWAAAMAGQDCGWRARRERPWSASTCRASLSPALLSAPRSLVSLTALASRSLMSQQPVYRMRPSMGP